MLDIDLVTILAEIINFLILAAALYFLLFKPAVKRIDQRTADKDAILKEIQEKEAEIEQKRIEIERRLTTIDAEIENSP